MSLLAAPFKYFTGSCVLDMIFISDVVDDILS